MSLSGHPPLQLASRPTLDPKTRMWIRSGDGYAADSLRYRVAKVHRARHRMVAIGEAPVPGEREVVAHC